MDKEILLSIIIPVYNSEKYINDTLDSILNQNFDKYEIILVNDGSTDNSLSIIEGYADEYKFIKIYTIPNGGPANARNFGLSVANGKYILFIDSDDTIVENALSLLLEKNTENEPDIVVFGFYQYDLNKKTKNQYRFRNCEINSKDELSNIFTELYRSDMLNQVWNKLFLAEFIKKNKILFQNFFYGEDRLFVLDAISYSPKILVVDECFYNYFLRTSSGSLVSKFYDRKFEACCLINQKVNHYLQQTNNINENNISDVSYMFIKSVISCMTNLFTKTCPYSLRQKYAGIREIIMNETVHMAASLCKDEGFYFNVIRYIIQSKITILNMFVSWIITKISISLPSLFIRAKYVKRKNDSN